MMLKVALVVLICGYATAQEDQIDCYTCSNCTIPDEESKIDCSTPGRNQLSDINSGLGVADVCGKMVDTDGRVHRFCYQENKCQEGADGCWDDKDNQKWCCCKGDYCNAAFAFQASFVLTVLCLLHAIVNGH